MAGSAHPAQAAASSLCFHLCFVPWSYLRALPCQRGLLACPDSDRERRTAQTAPGKTGRAEEPMRAMSVSRVTGHRPLCTVRPRAASWLRTSAPACSVTAAARCARLYSSGEQFTVYHDANCVISNSVVESLVSADAPYTTMSFLKKSPKEDTLRQVARVLEGGAELMLQDNSWPRVTDPNEVRTRSIWPHQLCLGYSQYLRVADRERVRQQPCLDAEADSCGS